MDSKEPFYLIDGSSYIFRAFYAIAPLTTKDGFPTNALYGFTKMLIKLLKDKSLKFGAVVFDAGRETFRTEIYSGYKANRKECPSELIPQIPFFRDISRALGFNVLEAPGFEADDILATLADKLSHAGHKVVLITSDKDLLQLVTEDIITFDPMKDKYLLIKDVEEKLGVRPDQVADYLTLTGDTSDNIPGVAGVGPKTAAQLLQLYGNLEKIISSLDEIRANKSVRNRNSIVEAFITSKEQIPISRRLTEVRKDVPLNFLRENPGSNGDAEVASQLQVHPIDLDYLNSLAEKFEFESLVKDLPKKFSSQADDDAQRRSAYQTVTKDIYNSWKAEFLQQQIYSIDLETTSLDAYAAEIVGIAVCWSKDKAYYLPFLHRNQPERNLDWQEFLRDCRPSLESAAVKKTGQNIKYDYKVFSANGVTLSGLYFDTMLASYLLDSERRSYSLDVLAEDYLNIKTIKYEEITAEVEDFSYLDIESATVYAAEDAHTAWLLYEKLAVEIEENTLSRLFDTIEMPLVEIIGKMELAGVLLDVDYLNSLSKEFGEKIYDYENRIAAMAGETINFNSTKQLSDLLFNKLNIPTKGLKKTKSGISTDSTVLEKLRKDYPIADLILEYRMYTKLKSTFIDAFVKIISPKTGRIHASFHQTGTATGRLSSSDPNLQNIPIQTAAGRRIRQAFIASPGNSLISADYSQIELRILAEMSGDENLIQTFIKDEDIHEKTAREIFSISPDDKVSKDQRRIGKTMNFGIIYGMGSFRLARELGIPFQQAAAYIELYFARYPKVRELFLKLENDAISKGYVETLFGRRRYIKNLDTTGRDDGFTARAAINAPIQGTAADLIKLAMISIDKKISLNGNSNGASDDSRLILQIHDELVFECKEDNSLEISQLIRNTMENVADWKVPLKVDASIGKNWEESKA